MKFLETKQMRLVNGGGGPLGMLKLTTCETTEPPAEDTDENTVKFKAGSELSNTIQ